MATLKDIAKKTNSSVSTVSRVLRNDPTLQLSTEKIKSIKETAKELDYKVKKSTKYKYNLLLFSWYDTNQELIDPYYMSIRIGIESYCKEHNINLKTIHKSENIVLNSEDYDCDGILCLGKFSESDAQIFAKLNSNVIFIDYNPNPNDYICVKSDLYSATINALQYIYDLNYRKILFVNGKEQLSDGSKIIDERLNAYNDFVKNNNLKSNIIETTFSYEGGENIVKNSNLSKYDCILTASDTIAIGILSETNENIKIIGFNDILVSKYIKPKLTTIKIDTQVIGKESVKQVIDLISEQNYEPKTILIPTKLIKRESI